MAKFSKKLSLCLILGGENYHIDGVIVAASDSIEINKKGLLFVEKVKFYIFASIITYLWINKKKI